MKKLASAFLSLVLCVSLSACGNGDKNSKSTTSTKPTIVSEKTANQTETVNKTTDTTILQTEPQPVSNKEENVYYGNWIVGKQLIIDPENFDAKTAKNRLKGNKIVYSAKSAKFSNNVCLNPTYKEIEYSNYDFFMKSRVEFRMLGITDLTVKAINIFTSGSSPAEWNSPGSHFLIRDKDSLILVDQGEYFILSRTK